MKGVAILSFIILSVVSCKSSKADLPLQSLSGTTWQLSELNGTAVDAKLYRRSIPYVTFETNTRISGNSGCNNFSGSYNLNDEGGINISQIAATKMFCEGVDEKGFFDALDNATVTKAQKDKLVLINGDTQIMVLVPKETNDR